MLSSSVVSAIERYFDAVWVVSLKKSASRRKQLETALAPLKYRLFWGQDAADYVLSDLEKQGFYDAQAALRHTNERRLLGLREVTCAWSHRRMYEAILKADLRRVLIFEDDVSPCPKTIAHLPEALSELPSDWEFCYFGYYGNETYSLSERLKQSLYRLTQPLGITHRVPRKVGRNRYPRPYSKHLRCAGFHYGAHAYALTYNACHKLCQHQTPIAFISDILFADLIYKQQLKAFITYAPFFDNRSVQGHTPSLIVNPS